MTGFPQGPAVEDELGAVVEDVRRDLGGVGLVLGGAAAHHLEEEDRALPGVDPERAAAAGLGSRGRSRAWAMEFPPTAGLRPDRSPFPPIRDRVKGLRGLRLRYMMLRFRRDRVYGDAVSGREAQRAMSVKIDPAARADFPLLAASDPDRRFAQKKACSPVWARPRIRACTSWVPS